MELLIVPVTISPSLNSPWILNTFNTSFSEFQPPTLTLPLAPLEDFTNSPSKNSTFLNSGVNLAKSASLIILPKLFVPS